MVIIKTNLKINEQNKIYLCRAENKTSLNQISIKDYQQKFSNLWMQLLTQKLVQWFKANF